MAKIKTSFEERIKDLSTKFPTYEDTEFLPTGSVIFDAVLGGGLPKGQLIELASESGLGKTTMVLHCCKKLCSMNLRCLYLDFEHAVNESQIKGIGLYEYLNKNFFLFQPNTFEDAEEILDSLMEETLTLVVIDSVTAMMPGKMADISVANALPGLQARYTSLFLQKYKAKAKISDITFIYINQMRTKLNFKGMSRVEAAGGQAQKYYMDIRLLLKQVKRLQRMDVTLEGDQLVPYGAHLAIWATKNRFARPYIEGIITVYYGKGVSNLSAYHRWLEDAGYIEGGSSGWYKIKWENKEEKIRGEKNLVDWVQVHLVEVKKLIEGKGGFLLIRENQIPNGEGELDFTENIVDSGETTEE